MSNFFLKNGGIIEVRFPSGQKGYMLTFPVNNLFGISLSEENAVMVIENKFITIEDKIFLNRKL